MARKKIVEVSPVFSPYERTYSDNNPDGPSNLPDDRLEGAMYPKGKFAFADLVANGESPEAPDVNTVNANGVARSRDEGRNLQSNWEKDIDGIWNKNKPWKGGNLSGL